MKKYIFTEQQIKAVINNMVNEQSEPSIHDDDFDSAIVSDEPEVMEPKVETPYRGSYVTNIINNIELVGTSDEGNPLVSMVLNVFVPNSTEKPEIGKRAKVTVVTEWIFWPYTRYRKMYLKIYSEKCVSVSSTVPLEKWMIEMIERKFHHNLLENVVEGIYEPIYYRSLKVNGKYDEVIKGNWYKDEETLRKLLMSVRKK
jgi:hypothetical protein